MTRTRTIAGCFALAGLLAGAWAMAQERMTMVSWGGAYGRATDRALLEPFGADAGVRISMEDFNGGLAEIRAQVETGNVHWDVVDLESADAIRGCDEGLLEELDPADLFPDQDAAAAAGDFLPGTLSDCGVGLIFYSTVYAYHRDHFPGERPATMADFFDVERFPGRRGMRRSPYGNLEFALVADGVPVDRVYEVLDSPGGIDRAFAMLDKIKEHVVWWEAGAQPPQMLADGEVVMTTAYNGRLFNAQVVENQPFEIVWDGQVLDHAQLTIVAGTPNLDTALQFLAFAARPESMAAMSRYISYSPVRGSAMALVTTHADTGVDMAAHMPATPERLERSVFNDWAWWADFGEQVNERFGAWLAR
ncbi:MAG: ABC transporter substrate-binding protein [Spirochaetaceae bacterium]|nr:ABC transporter substrate-binding protein [Spirochaetaceae bacterium]